MSNWIELTPDDVRDNMNATELTAYRTKLAGPGTPDPLPGIIAQVVYQIRGAVRSCGKNRLHETATLIPRSAEHHAVVLVLYRLANRFRLDVTEDRRAEWREANRWLRDVAACQYDIEPPTDEADAAGPVNGPNICRPNRTMSRRDQEGI
ncbi:MAG TPA: DUF1320 family protein [Bacteroidia bacterium]|nr:DUF1320 family protein [Bacteroidia bacterium]